LLGTFRPLLTGREAGSGVAHGMSRVDGLVENELANGIEVARIVEWDLEDWASPTMGGDCKEAARVVPPAGAAL